MAEKTPTYLKTHRLKGKALQFLLDEEVESTLGRARASASGRTARTLVKQAPISVTLVSMKKGAKLRRHKVAGPVAILCLRGSLRLRLSGEDRKLSSGGLVVLAAGVAHDVEALRDSSMLLTMSGAIGSS